MTSHLNFKLLVKVETFIANTREEATEHHDAFMKENYEGSIIRNLDAPYEFSGIRELRTYQIRKRKPRYSGEYEIIGYAEGTRGKDKGAIIWELKTAGDEKKGIVSTTFTATPVGMTYEERYDIFRTMTKKRYDSDYKNKYMTIEYDDLSDQQVPLRAKAKGIRTIA